MNLGVFDMRIKTSNGAVSELLATLLLLAIAVIVVSIIYIQVLSDEGPNPKTIVKIAGDVEGTNVILEHRGGESLQLNTEISIIIAGTEYQGTIGQWLDDENNDSQWNIGERMIFSDWEYDLDRLGEFTQVDLQAINVEDNSIAFVGPIELHPVSDIGIEIFVGDEKPVIGQTIPIVITVTSYGGDVNGSGNVVVKYQIPEGLTFQNAYSSQGTYNDTSGYWEIGNVLVGTPAILHINATVEGIVFHEFTQLGMALDGSGSIDYSDWQLMRTGLAEAIRNESNFPHDGSVELTVVQFGVDPYDRNSRVEIPPTIITQSNYATVANSIESLNQGDGWTPMAGGIYLTADTMRDSENFDPIHRQIINLVTDGEPTCWSAEGEYQGHDCGTSTSSVDVAKTSTENAVNYVISQLELTEDQDEFDSLAVGSGPDIPWLNSSIVWPQPGYIAPPFKNESGWVSQVQSWNEFAARINEMFRIIFYGISNTAELVSSTTFDPDENNNHAIVIVLPDE